MNTNTNTTTDQYQTHELNHPHQQPPPPSSTHDQLNHPHQQPPPPSSTHDQLNHPHQQPPPPSSTHDQLNHPQQQQQQQPPHPSSSSLPSDPAKPSNTENVTAADAEKWGTHIMGPPGVPASHPNNQKAALWSAEDHHPYVQHSPMGKPSNSPMESVVDVFNSWTHKTETLARNIWQNLKTGNSMSEVAWGKLGLTAKAISGGGFESLYKQTFETHPNEKLKRTFACYLSTTTGPVAGTLYLSNIHVAFCSDRPLCFTAPSGQQAWSYYKVMIPLGKISAMNPVSMRENPSEKYIQINTVDGHDFWFMGFVNYEKALVHLTDSFSEFVAHQLAAQPQVVG